MPGFDLLSPSVILAGVEAAYGLRLEPIVTPYSSYVNRVYGLQDVDGRSFVAKFYRPDRWSDDAIEEEHAFVEELAEAEVPVVRPLVDQDGDSLAYLAVESPEESETYRFALYPKRSGRLFDNESDEAWRRIGALCGRIHSVGALKGAQFRPRLAPEASTSSQLDLLIGHELLPADLTREFEDLARGTVILISELFDGRKSIRLHGDLHRGNILDRDSEGLLLIDLDDAVSGPAVQDLWLLLPGRRNEVARELGLLAEGYEDFRPFPWEELELIEALRFMRMIHFIAWSARQREDRDFHSHFPDWGKRAWWIKEIEDLRDQARLIIDPD